MASKIRISLIHATQVSIQPVQEAFSLLWPEAQLLNIMDDSLSSDLLAAGSLTDKIVDRIISLATYSKAIDADGILYTCSAFGEAIERAKEQVPIPVLKPNEAMFEEAVAAGGHSGMLATFGPSVSSMEREYEETTKLMGRESRISTILVEEAMKALLSGDLRTHNQLLSEEAIGFKDIDILMLAQFSTSRAYELVSSSVRCKVLTSPRSAVGKLKREIIGKP